MRRELDNLQENLKQLQSKINDERNAANNIHWQKFLDEVAKALGVCMKTVTELPIPSPELPEFLLRILEAPNLAESRVYESQVDAKTVTLLQHFFSILNNFAICPQWSLNPEVETALIDKMNEWSMAAQDSTDRSVIPGFDASFEMFSAVKSDSLEPDFEDQSQLELPSFDQFVSGIGMSTSTPLTSRARHQTERFSANFRPSSIDVLNLESNTGNFASPGSRSHSISVIPDAKLDWLGRLVVNHPGRLPRKVPDVVVVRMKKAWLVVENKKEDRRAGRKQLEEYMKEFGPDTWGMTCCIGEHYGLIAALCKKHDTGRLLWIRGPGSDEPDDPVWYRADDPFIVGILTEIFNQAMKA
ncbi:hypothetical protein VKT23_020190 [Stygiomarasmius scandens]|uniref:Uncharacterized protein n=1 Tax=Marasmiellus scandens TaxID=2682957 RepID=A0ABR1IN53_9AGAR